METNVVDKNLALKLKVTKWVLSVGIILMAGKFFAYFITSSSAIFSDALESVVNILTSCFALFSVYYAAKPKDSDHPYGHGKIEFFASGIVGVVILVAGMLIIYQSVYSFFENVPLQNLDIGIWIVAVSGLINFILGKILVNHGKKYQSITMQADGKHLITDTLTSIGITGGLIVVYFTGIDWLDKVMAVIFAILIMVMGYRLMRSALSGLMDEADIEVLEEISNIIQSNRKEKWIDIHNLRILKYGSSLHIDCHMTLPWYDQLEVIHNEVDEIENLVRSKMKNNIEFFIHADPCKPKSCPVCLVKDCPVRQKPFEKEIKWDLKVLVKDQRHES